MRTIRRITWDMVSYIQTKEITLADEKLLKSLLKRQRKYPELTINQWNQVKRLMSLPIRKRGNDD